MLFMSVVRLDPAAPIHDCAHSLVLIAEQTLPLTLLVGETPEQAISTATWWSLGEIPEKWRSA